MAPIPAGPRNLYLFRNHYCNIWLVVEESIHRAHCMLAICGLPLDFLTGRTIHSMTQSNGRKIIGPNAKIFWQIHYGRHLWGIRKQSCRRWPLTLPVALQLLFYTFCMDSRLREADACERPRIYISWSWIYSNLNAQGFPLRLKHVN